MRGMGSEQVASVLRQSGTHVHLIVARGIIEPTVDFPPYAPIIPTIELTEHLRQLNEALLLHAQDFPGYIVPPEAGLVPADNNPPTFQTVLPAEIHPVNITSSQYNDIIVWCIVRCVKMLSAEQTLSPDSNFYHAAAMQGGLGYRKAVCLSVKL